MQKPKLHNNEKQGKYGRKAYFEKILQKMQKSQRAQGKHKTEVKAVIIKKVLFGILGKV